MQRKQGPFLGSWWIAGNSAQPVGGRLDLGDAFELQTAGDLKSKSGISAEHLPNSFIVEGQSLGNCITLYECVAQGWRFSDQDTQHEIFSPTVLVGPRFFSQPASAVFDRAAFRLDNANQFANRFIFGMDSTSTGGRTATYTPVPDLIADVPGARITMGRRLDHSLYGRLERIELESNEGFTVELSEKLSIDDLMFRYIRPLRQLISLATARDCIMRDLHVADSETLAEEREYFGVHFWKSKPDDPTREVVNPNMRFSLNSMMNRPAFPFEELVPRWFSISKKYGAALDLIFSLRTSTGYLESKIFAVASSLEGLHRRLYPSAGKRTQEQKKRLEEILRSAPDKHRDWLEKALEYSHQPSYSQRVHDLLAHAGTAVTDAIGDANNWVRIVGEARNAVAHARGIDNDDVMPIFDLMRSIQMLAEVLLLRELGLSGDECSSIVRRDFEYQTVRPRLAESYPQLFSS